jgi:hypothetical protein
MQIIPNDACYFLHQDFRDERKRLSISKQENDSNDFKDKDKEELCFSPEEVE